MLSDMLWGGSFHRHIMMIGGRTATPARKAQLDSELVRTAMPATQTAKTQRIVTTTLMDRSCMSEEYTCWLAGRCLGMHT